MKVIWTKHSIERQREWEIKIGVKKEDVENVLISPEQIVPGDLNAQVAQSKFNNGLIRIPFVRQNEDRKILTVYWTSKIEKYWKEIEGQ